MIRKDIKKGILEFFLVTPSAKLRFREIERKLGFPLPSVIRYCGELVKERFLKLVKVGSVVFYTADRENEKYLLEKKLFNLRQVYDSGLVDYIRGSLNNPVIVLFGSFAKGEDVEESDVDLYLETLSKKSVNLEKFEKVLQRKIQVFRYDNIRKVPNNHLRNNIINGITLNNYVEVFK